MELNTLKKLRTIAPGLTVLIFLMPLYYQYFDKLIKLGKAIGTLTGTTGLVFSYIIGAIFNSLQLRAIRNSKSHDQITSNIKAKLFNAGRTIPVRDEDKDEIFKSRAIMHIFYGFIDNDDSLKEKAKLVRSNGIFWTTTADVAVISVAFSLFYFLFSFFSNDSAIFLYSGLIIGTIGLLSGARLHPMSVKRHIELSDEQLDYIIFTYKSELEDKINAL